MSFETVPGQIGYLRKAETMNSELPGNPDFYLGDGVYAKMAHNGDIRMWTHREDGIHSVAMDREVFKTLLDAAGNHWGLSIQIRELEDEAEAE